jgi:type 2 lantibiotic biosynthesis protein LanM
MSYVLPRSGAAARRLLGASPETMKHAFASEIDIAHIARRSATLPERLVAAREHGLAQPYSADAEAVIRHRMAAWARRLTRDSRPYLADRLRSDNASLSLAAAACSPELPLAEGSAPAWLAPFLAGVERLAAGEIDLAARASGTPFADILTAFVPDAERLLLGEGDDIARSWHGLPDEARRSAREHLVSRLSAVAQWCLYARFDAARHETPTESAYERFVNAAPEWAYEFFHTFAGLARPFGHVMTFWAQSMAELLRRWADDRAEISRFLDAPDDIAISAFEAFPSDPHNHGRGVVVIVLSSGHRIVYKPTPGRLSSLWADAVALTIGSATNELVLLDKGEYAWHRYLPSCRPVVDALPADLRRLGEMLALATALGTTDLHYENFIVTSSGPQLVDHETTLSPAPRAPRVLPAAERAAARASFASVLATGALPNWAPGPMGEIWNANAFGWQQGEKHSAVFPFLTHPNAGQMRISTDHAERGADRGRLQSADGLRAHARELGRGFRDGWRTIAPARSELSHLVEEASGATARVMLRDTRFYAELLGQGHMPRYCHDVLDRSLLFEHLHRAILDAQPASDRWQLCRAEHDALIRADIPCFITAVDGVEAREAATSRKRGVRLRAASPALHAARNLRSLTVRNAERNVALIHSAFDAAAWPGVSSHTVTPRRRTVGGCDGWRARRALAADVFSAIRVSAFTGRNDHSIALIGASLEQTGRGQRVGVCASSDTYAGIAGLGLLAAVLHRCVPHRRHLDTALRVADTMSITASDLASDARGQRFGAFAGAPGVAFILLKLGELLGAPHYIDLAADLMAAAYEVPEDSDLDVMSGVAGACLVTAALIQHAPHRAADLMPALAHGGAELRSRACLSVNGRECTWPTMGQTGGVSGFSHGIAGIAAALARLHTVNAGSYTDLTQMALAREDAFFLPSAGGWPTTGGDGSGPIVTDAWCYGAAGVLLSISEVVSTGVHVCADMRDRATRAACAARPATDGLCHGEAGVALALLRSARLLGDSELALAGTRRLDMLGSRHANGGGLRVEPVEAIEHASGLMCGASGIAFAAIAPEAGPEAVDVIGIA